MSASRVVVTGGCGFVGAHLCALLAQRGYEVVAMDNLSVGTPANLGSVGQHNIQVAEIDVRDASAVACCLQYYQPHTVFHLAALHFIPACDADPASCISINVDGTQSVLDACAVSSTVKTVVLTSTAAVYKPAEQAHYESSELAPTDVYGLSKLWSEQLAALFHRKTEISVGVARLFNVFGPGETNPHLIPTIIEQVQRSAELALGNLSTYRDYVYVGDVAAALLALSERCRDHGILTCNVGSERQIDGSHLVELIGALSEQRPRVLADPARMRVSDRPHLLSDCRRAHEILGWHARTTLEQGLREAYRQPFAAGSQKPAAAAPSQLAS